MAASGSWVSEPAQVAVKATMSPVTNGLVYTGSALAYPRRKEVHVIVNQAIQPDQPANPNTRVPQADHDSTVHGIKALTVSKGTFIFVGMAGSVKVISGNGTRLIFEYELENECEGKTWGMHAKGLTAINTADGDVFVAGTSSGSLIAFRDNEVEAKMPSGYEYITDLCSDLETGGSGSEFACATLDGKVSVWGYENKEFVQICDIELTPYPVNGIKMRGDTIVAGCGDGMMRVISRSGSLLAEVSAHSRTVTAVSISPSVPTLFATVGLDSYLNVWNVEQDGKVTNVKTSRVVDSCLYGVAFVGGSIVAAAYDKKYFHLFKAE